MPGQPTMVEVRAWIKVGPDQLTDDELARIYQAAIVGQAKLCKDTDPPEALPDPLAQALLRRVQREVAARALPLGLVGAEAAEYGPTAVPYFDALVEGHERPYRRVVVG